MSELAKSPLTYINRCGKTHYFRTALTAKGGIRYYITKSDNFPDLIDAVPHGFEIYEDPYEGRVIFRKIVSCLITSEEMVFVKNAVERLSDLNDIIIQAEGDAIIVWVSQFNSIDGREDKLTDEEVIEFYGDNTRLWKKYDDKFKFVLIDAEKRLFQAERRVYMSLDGAYMPLKKGKGSLLKLTNQFCPHMGRESYFHTVPEGFDE